MHQLSLELQEFFFEAARETYAGHGTKTSIEGLPKSKVYRYEKGNFLYIDTYFTNGEQSGGQTVIYIKPEGSSVFVPAWIMQYHGWCENDDGEIIGLLKVVLTKAYLSRTFYGGRGKLHDKSAVVPHLEYTNNWIGTFDHFSGEEKISKEDIPEGGTGLETREVFWHRYQGMTLLQEVQQEK